MRRCDRKCVLSVILRHLSVNIFATNMLFFTASFDVTVEAKCITYVTLDSIGMHFASVNASAPSPFPREI